MTNSSSGRTQRIYLFAIVVSLLVLICLVALVILWRTERTPPNTTNNPPAGVAAPQNVAPNHPSSNLTEQAINNSVMTLFAQTAVFENAPSEGSAPIAPSTPPATPTPSLQVITRYNAVDLQLLSSLEVEESTSNLTWSPDSRFLALSSKDGIWIYPHDSGTLTPPPEYIPNRYGDLIAWLQYTQDGRLLAISVVLADDLDTEIDKIWVWNAQTGEELFYLPMTPPDDASWELISMAISPDGNTLAFGVRYFGGDYSDEVQAWNLETGEKLYSSPREMSPASLVFSPDGTQLAVGMIVGAGVHSPFEGVTILDAATGTSTGHSIRVGELSYDAPWVIDFSADKGFLIIIGNQLSMGLREPYTLVYNITTREVESLGKNSFGPSFSPDGSLVAYGKDAGYRPLSLWDIASQTNLVEIDVGDTIYRSAFSPDGRVLATLHRHKVRLWGVRQ